MTLIVILKGNNEKYIVKQLQKFHCEISKAKSI